ncbi:MAG: DUF3105 domain-containing protein [Dehalococcoidia bacterium]
MRLAALALAAAIIVALAGCSSGGGRPEYAYEVQTFEDKGREHLPQGQEYSFYNSNPPTSGPHAPAPAPWGVSDTTLPKEVPVHNMEHGGVVIWYDCSAGSAPLDEAGCGELRDQLRGVTERKIDEGKQVLTVPFSSLDHRINLTAWTTLDGFDEFDQERVEAFIDAYDRWFNPEGF